MDVDGYAAEILIDYLTWRPQYILNSVISVSEVIKPSAPLRPRSYPSSKLFDTLPTEILHSVLNRLDFRSLCRLSQVSYRGKEVVETLPTYTTLIKHASAALIALSRTKLITVHSAASIYAQLRSKTCVCCQDYGPFLSLLTCERCCYECSISSQYLRAERTEDARNFFGLSSDDLDKLPVMTTINGYQADLVSWQRAKQLAIAVHGSQEALERFVSCNTRSQQQQQQQQYPSIEWIADLLQHPVTSGLGGIASVEFPFLSPNASLEKGLWCNGCRTSPVRSDLARVSDCEKDMLDLGLRSKLSCMTPQLAVRAERRARSRSDFLEHIRECTGARILMSRYGNRGKGDVDIDEKSRS